MEVLFCSIVLGAKDELGNFCDLELGLDYLSVLQLVFGLADEVHGLEYELILVGRKWAFFFLRILHWKLVHLLGHRRLFVLNFRKYQKIIRLVQLDLRVNRNVRGMTQFHLLFFLADRIVGALRPPTRDLQQVVILFQE